MKKLPKQQRLSMKLLWKMSGDFTAQKEESESRFTLNRFLNFVEFEMKGFPPKNV